jgi:hypothetical protein
MRGILYIGDYVKEMMDAVTEIHIGSAAGGVHDLCSWGTAAIPGMGGFIYYAFIGFCFNDPAGSNNAFKLCNQDLAEQFPGYLHYVLPQVKRSFQWLPVLTINDRRNRFRRFTWQ